MFTTLFIANRGEIAARIARTCDRLGIAATVSSGDYLDPDAQIAQARAVGAQAIHPGYGFLSERPDFARAVAAAGLVWVGPPPEAMEAMARKDHAREIAVAAGVPVVPSWGGFETGLRPSSTTEANGGRPSSTTDGPGLRPSEVSGDRVAREGRTGVSRFPVLVKAAAGGGGKGMRIVRDPAELDEAMAAAAREARGAFGDDTLLIERYVERGRHIEVQILADSHGHVVHLHERDCSTQRRHQKVLEEAPAPTLTPDLRTRITEAAVALAREVGYVNAGTVEFLLDEQTGEFYFLEMNTRLQVEHPVTEEVVRIRGERLDLVELQLRVAAGEPLGIDQDDVAVEGHAIEARVYAEDAFGGFLPQAGTATHVEWPGGVRVDHALESGQVVSTAYDPMLGKVIVHGRDREAARRGLVAALDRTAILGLTTNTGFLRVLAASEEFRDAVIDTAWLDRHEVPAPDAGPARLAAAWEVFLARREEQGAFRSDGFRIAGDPAPIVVELDEPVVLSGPEPRASARPAARVARGRVELVHQGQRWVFTQPDGSRDDVTIADGVIAAPMPGTVLDVRIADGDRVEPGQVLVVLEAMKMELALEAPFAGTVSGLSVAAGDQVALGATLLEVEADE